MNLLDYQIAASRTCPDLGSLEKNLLHMDVGIETEIGEVLDIYKKNFAYNKQLDVVHIGEELADISWYAVNKLRLLGFELSGHYLSANTTILRDLDSIFKAFRSYQNGLTGEVGLIGICKNIADNIGLDYNKLLDTNIAKLKARYPDKFDTERALNRNLEAERKILEDGNNNKQTEPLY